MHFPANGTSQQEIMCKTVIWMYLLNLKVKIINMNHKISDYTWVQYFDFNV